MSTTKYLRYSYILLVYIIKFIEKVRIGVPQGFILEPILYSEYKYHIFIYYFN